MHKKYILVSVTVMLFSLLSACSKQNINIIDSKEVDTMIVYINTDNKDQLVTANDPAEIERIINNIKAIFNKKIAYDQFSDVNMRNIEKKYNYELQFYKNDTLIQTIEINRDDQLLIDDKKYIIKNSKQKEVLNSLKVHILTISK
ncbi:hypothetical protein [Enterococcus sp. AZ102]|uniref:hypothetical protein n=1 Tax=Enterococcus sp. AZ102 TaxID=2774865 RepID=UPI003F1EE5FD